MIKGENTWWLYIDPIGEHLFARPILFCQRLAVTAVLNYQYRDDERYLPFLFCLEQGKPYEDGEFCAKKNGQDWGQISGMMDIITVRKKKSGKNLL